MNTSFPAGQRPLGHAAALVSILVWGVTFVSTKVLLRSFTPIEILFIRFALGWVALRAVCPEPLRVCPRWREGLFALAGASGITLYFLLENMALEYTFASNVGVIVAVAPFMTGLLAWLFLKNERPGPAFFAGFGLAITGIAVMDFSAVNEFGVDPAGDLLAFAAALAWAVYSVATRKIGEWGYGSLPVTRRIFFYGLVFMLPCLPLFDFSPSLGALISPLNILNLLFLGLVASALCFVTWTFALERLGAIRATVYIYLVPVVTLISSAIILGERLSLLSIMGCLMTIAGLFFSEAGSFRHFFDKWNSGGEDQPNDRPGNQPGGVPDHTPANAARSSKETASTQTAPAEGSPSPPAQPQP